MTMTYKDIIKQLESLKDNSQSFAEKDKPDSIWQQDINALDAAIDIVKSCKPIYGYWKNGCECSECGMKYGPRNKNHKKYYNYCPVCGARMNRPETGG